MRTFIERHLRRITSPTTAYEPWVDGLRFVAIGLVFLYHLAGDILKHSPGGYGHGLVGDPIFGFTQHANFGVQMFFVLSGYVLLVPFARAYFSAGPVVNAKRYYLRRLTRLEPPYLVTLTVFLLLKVLAGRGDLDQLIPHYAASVFYLHNLLYAAPSDINFVAWSLEVEVQFYLLAPLLAHTMFSVKQPLVRRALLVGVALVATYLSSVVESPRLSLTLLPSAKFFLAGALMADVMTSTKVSVRAVSPTPLWDWGCLCAAFLLIWAFRIEATWALMYVSPFVVAFAYVCVAQGGVVRAALSVPSVSAIGGMCYSIYLTHNYAIAALGGITQPWTRELGFTGRLLVQSLPMGLAVLVVAAITFVLVERPCMDSNWPSKCARRVRAIRFA